MAIRGAAGYGECAMEQVSASRNSYEAAHSATRVPRSTIAWPSFASGTC